MKNTNKNKVQLIINHKTEKTIKIYQLKIKAFEVI